jgi:3-mercaptopyruvate sulfurtransferase SseA
MEDYNKPKKFPTNDKTETQNCPKLHIRQLNHQLQQLPKWKTILNENYLVIDVRENSRYRGEYEP